MSDGATAVISPNRKSEEVMGRLQSLSLRSKYEEEDDDLEDDEIIDGIRFVKYRDESQLPDVMRLVGRDLSEPYSVFTYRYFLHQWPEFCILAVPKSSESNREPIPIGCVVCKVDEEEDEVAVGLSSGAKVEGEEAAEATESDAGTAAAKDAPSPNGTSAKGGATNGTANKTLSGYVAMLAVDTSHRRSGIGTALAKRAIRKMRQMGCQSVCLETEVSNKSAMRLYEDRLGFIREELLVRYYLNWGDAYRLRLWFD